MAGNIVYFDLETQRSAADVGGWDKKHAMGVSVAVTYSSATEEYQIYPESRMTDLVEELTRADMVVGYNVIDFDYQVLGAYSILDLAHCVPTLDLLTVVEKVLGHRIALDAIATATLGVGKTAEGKQAIRWWREGKLREIAEYCCFDVKVTRLVHEYARHFGELYYADRGGNKTRMEITWP